nr:hypothetical protein [Paracoccus mutanolyticus]
MRGIFLPIGMVLVSVYATSMAPPPGWTQSFGLGGHLGDMLMGAMLSVMPVKASIAIKVLALLTAAAAAGFMAFVLGFDKRELGAIGRFLREGLATARLLALHGVDRGARLSSGAAQRIRTKAEARRDRTARAGDAVLPDEAARPARRVAPPPRSPVIRPQSELVEPEPAYPGDAGPSDEANQPDEGEIRLCLLRSAQRGPHGSNRAVTGGQVQPLPDHDRG